MQGGTKVGLHAASWQLNIEQSSYHCRGKEGWGQAFHSLQASEFGWLKHTGTENTLSINVAMVTSIFSVNYSNHTLLCPSFISAYNIDKSDEGIKMVSSVISHLLLFPSRPRHHYSSDDDYSEYNSQEVVT